MVGMTKFQMNDVFFFATAHVQDENVKFWLSLTFFCVLALLCIGYIVWRLGDTSNGSTFFRFFFPPRRQRTQPWGWGTIVLALFVFLGCSLATQLVVIKLFPEKVGFEDEINVTKREPVEPDEKSTAKNDESEESLVKSFSQEDLSEQHQLTILMQKAGRYPSIIILCFLMAVIVAPLSEEFFFRVLVQGGIEATLRREFGQRVWSKSVPALVTALFFAAIHFRLPQEQVDDDLLDFLFKGFLTHLVGNLIAIAVVVAILRRFHRIRWSDIGLWDFKRLPRDAAGAFLLLVIVLLPIFFVNTFTTTLFKQVGIPASMADPIPLFLFAMILGTLYARTRRLASVFFLHAFFNLYSFLILLYLAFAK